MGEPTEAAVKALMRQLMRDEGFSATPVKLDGRTRIGFGRDLERGVTPDEAAVLLAHDLAQVTAQVRAVLPWVDTLSEARRSVLVHLAYTLGMPAFLQLRAVLEPASRGRLEEAARALLATDWARLHGPRAERLAEQLRTGAWR